LPVDLPLDDLRQFADHELERRRRSLRCPKPPVPEAQRRVLGDLDLAGHVLGIVFLTLRIGQRQEWPFEPEGGHALELLTRADAGAEHLETAALVQEESTDANGDGLTALAAGGVDVGRDRRAGTRSTGN